MLTVHAFTDSANLQVHLQHNPHPPPSKALLQQVDAIWQQEQHRRKQQNCNALFNGELFCVDHYHGNAVWGHRSEYRFWVAQFLHPQLFTQLQMRPLAVAGLLRCQQGLVFGKRGLSNTTGAGLWELIPSGGVDTRDCLIGKPIDMIPQIQLEFREETGCDPQIIEQTQPLCLIENHQTHSIDIGLLLQAPRLNFSTLETNHATTTLEYTELHLVAIDNLLPYLQQTSDQLVAISTKLVQYWMQHEKIGHHE